MNLQDLPIYSHKEQIIQTYLNNQCFIVTGTTGCGKSTLLPILLFNNFKGKQKIICTQPRRVACINIATQVSRQLNSQLGQLVGYHIGTDPCVSSQTRISFVTIGIFLNYLIHDPEQLSHYDCVILDEVHERDLNLDFTLMILKILLTRMSHLKVVLMSATLETEKISAYFSPQEIFSAKVLCEKQLQKYIETKRENSNPKFEGKKEEEKKVLAKLEQNKFPEIKSEALKSGQIPIISIASTMPFKVETYFLDQLDSFRGFHSDTLQRVLQNQMVSLKPILVSEYVQVSIELIKYILLQSTKKYLKILVFLPGLNELIYYGNQLKDHLGDLISQTNVILVHSSLMNKEYFSQMTHEENQILIATNLAESSITIPNIEYIIDFFLTKEQKFARNRSNYLGLEWSSQSSSVQRRGRTGRCNDGLYFLMVSQRFFQQQRIVLEPEILKVPLDRLFLKVNIIQEKLRSDSEDFFDFIMSVFRSPFVCFGFCIEKINEAELVNSKNYLLQQNAISQKGRYFFRNTLLGNLYAELPLELSLVKLILFGRMSGCLREAIQLAGVLGTENSAFISQSKILEAQKVEEFRLMILEMAEGHHCDYLILLKLYQQWEQVFQLDSFEEGGSNLAKQISKIN